MADKESNPYSGLTREAIILKPKKMYILKSLKIFVGETKLNSVILFRSVPFFPNVLRDIISILVQTAHRYPPKKLKPRPMKVFPLSYLFTLFIIACFIVSDQEFPQINIRLLSGSFNQFFPFHLL